ncbi:MAG: sugar ABC transporter ATP-binding protein [Flexilinea sp.]
MREEILQLNSISKSFPGVKALDNVSFSIERGSVHCIIGENGAGKSTLIKILSGALQKDSGTIIYEGKEVDIRNSHQAKKLGISTVYQEMSLVPSLTAIENLFLGDELTTGVKLDKSQMAKKAREALGMLNVSFNINIPVSFLNTAQQQMIEIMRSVIFDRKMIIMDEPSSSLSQKDVSELFRIIRFLKEKDVTIIYISHKLDELEQIGDRLTVMRDGKHIKTMDIAYLNMSYVVSLMVGREFDTSRRPKERSLDSEVVLEVQNISRADKRVDNVSFKLNKGIILGFAGLIGSGRTELMRIIFGADKFSSGSIYIKNKKIEKFSTKNAVKNGIAYLSEDRKNVGVLLGMSIRENMTIANLSRISKGFVIDKKQEKEQTDLLYKKIHIVTSSLDKLALYLSGGNQQKVAIAKWLFTNCDILIFDEPTRGIDVGARSEIYLLMNQLVDDGKSIILVSSDLTEVLSMSNKIIVMHEGKIVKETKNEITVTQETIMQYMLGGFRHD